MPGVRNVELVLVGALVVSAPSLFQAFTGGIGLTTALLRLAVALALCWAAGAVVERVIDSYARENRRRMFQHHMARINETAGDLVRRQRGEGDGQ